MVTLEQPGAEPAVERRRTGRYDWTVLDLEVHGATAAAEIERAFAGLCDDASRVGDQVVRAKLGGVVSLAQRPGN